jgi:hypothetical protein
LKLVQSSFPHGTMVNQLPACKLVQQQDYYTKGVALQIIPSGAKPCKKDSYLTSFKLEEMTCHFIWIPREKTHSEDVAVY